jgi:hypothetical protein
VIEVTDDVIGLLLLCRGEEERGLGDQDHACDESEASQEPEDPAVFLPERGPDTFTFAQFCVPIPFNSLTCGLKKCFWPLNRINIYIDFNKILSSTVDEILFWGSPNTNQKYLREDALAFGRSQGVTKRCRLSWLTNSALAYMSPNAGGGGLRGLSQ